MKNNSVRVCALKFGTTRCRIGNAQKITVHDYAHLNLVLCGAELVKHGKIIVRTKFITTQCGLGGACVILAHIVSARIILARVVCALLEEHRGIFLVHAQCWYAMHAC
jgi:hypothetical protein